MPPSIAAEKHQQSERVAVTLDESVNDLEAVLLFGSVARGDAEPASDLDLMLIARSPVGGRVPRAELPRSASVVCHTWESLQAARHADWSFFVHLREEGEPLRGDTGLLREELGAVRQPPPSALRASREEDLRSLERFDDLDRFGDSYLFPLARLFTVAKRACMRDNTAHGVLAFERERAFDLYAERHPSVELDVNLVRRLWPFLAQTQGRRPALPLEFDDPRGMAEAVGSTRRMIRAAADG